MHIYIYTHNSINIFIYIYNMYLSNLYIYTIHIFQSHHIQYIFPIPPGQQCVSGHSKHKRRGTPTAMCQWHPTACTMWSGKVLNLFKIVFIINEQAISGRVVFKIEKRKTDESWGKKVTLELWCTVKPVKLTKWTRIMCRLGRALGMSWGDMMSVYLVQNDTKYMACVAQYVCTLSHQFSGHRGKHDVDV